MNFRSTVILALALASFSACSSTTKESFGLSEADRKYVPLNSDEFILMLAGENLQVDLDEIQSIRALPLSQGAKLVEGDRGSVKNCVLPSYAPEVSSSEYSFEKSIGLSFKHNRSSQCIYVLGKKSNQKKSLTLYVETETGRSLRYYEDVAEFHREDDLKLRNANIANELSIRLDKPVEIKPTENSKEITIQVGRDEPILLRDNSANTDLVRSYSKIGAPARSRTALSQAGNAQARAFGKVVTGVSSLNTPVPSSLTDSLQWSKAMVFDGRSQSERQARDILFYAFGSVGGKWTWADSQLNTDAPFPIMEDPTNYYTGLLSQLPIYNSSVVSTNFGKGIIFTSDQPGLHTYDGLVGDNLLNRSQDPGSLIDDLDNFLQIGLSYNLGIGTVIFDGEGHVTKFNRRLRSGNKNTTIEDPSDLILDFSDGGTGYSDYDVVEGEETVTYYPIANYSREIALEQIDLIRSWMANVITGNPNLEEIPEDQIYHKIEEFVEQELRGNYQTFWGNPNSTDCDIDNDPHEGNRFSNLKGPELSEPLTPFGDGPNHLSDVLRSIHETFCPPLHQSGDLDNKARAVKNIFRVLSRPKELVIPRYESDGSVTILLAAFSHVDYEYYAGSVAGYETGTNGMGWSYGLSISPASVYFILSAYNAGLFDAETSLAESFMDNDHIVRIDPLIVYSTENLGATSILEDLSRLQKFATNVHGHAGILVQPDASIYKRVSLSQTLIDETVFDPESSAFGPYERIQEGSSRRQSTNAALGRTVDYSETLNSFVQSGDSEAHISCPYTDVNYLETQGNQKIWANEGECKKITAGTWSSGWEHFGSESSLGWPPNDDDSSTCPPTKWFLGVENCTSTVAFSTTKFEQVCPGPLGKGCPDDVSYIQVPLMEASSQCTCFYQDGAGNTRDHGTCQTPTIELSWSVESFPGLVGIERSGHRATPEIEVICDRTNCSYPTDFCGDIAGGTCPTGTYFVSQISSCNDVCSSAGSGSTAITTDAFYPAFFKDYDSLTKSDYEFYRPSEVWGVRQEFLYNLVGSPIPGSDGYRNWEMYKTYMRRLGSAIEGGSALYLENLMNPGIEYDEAFEIPRLDQLALYNSHRLVYRDRYGASRIRNYGGTNTSLFWTDLEAGFRPTYGKDANGEVNSDNLYSLIYNAGYPESTRDQVHTETFQFNSTLKIPQLVATLGSGSQTHVNVRPSMQLAHLAALPYGSYPAGKFPSTEWFKPTYNTGNILSYELETEVAYWNNSTQTRVEKTGGIQSVSDDLGARALGHQDVNSQQPPSQPVRDWISISYPSNLSSIFSNRWSMTYSWAGLGKTKVEEWNYGQGRFCKGCQSGTHSIDLTTPKQGAPVYSFVNFSGNVSLNERDLSGTVTFYGDVDDETDADAAGNFSKVLDFSSLRLGPVSVSMMYENDLQETSDELIWLGYRVGGCRTSNDCPQGAVCLNGRCEIQGCQYDYQCRDTEKCEDGECVHDDNNGSDSCSIDSDCAPGSACINGFCTEYGCQDDSECMGGIGRCVNGECEGPNTCIPVSDCGICSLYGDQWSCQFEGTQRYCCEGDFNGNIRECNSTSGSPCNEDHPCPLEGQVCVNTGNGWGRCYSECDPNGQCPGGQICDADFEGQNICCYYGVPLPGPINCSGGSSQSSGGPLNSNGSDWSLGEGTGICPGGSSTSN